MKKNIALILSVLVFVAGPASAFAQSADTLSRIQALLAQIQQLQALLIVLQGGQTGTTPVVSPVTSTTGASSSCIILGRSLSRGMTGADVRQLQQFLGSGGYLSATPNGTFDAVTESAVQDFQYAQGVITYGSPDTTGYGAVGPQTRSSIQRMSCAAGIAHSTPVVTTPTPVPVYTPTPVVPTPVVTTPVVPVTPVVTPTPVVVTPVGHTCQINGLTFAEGASRTMYTVESVSAGGDCTPYHSVRTCVNGSFTGNPSAIYFSCSVPRTLLSCTVGTVTLASGASRTFYSAQNAAAGTSCSSLAQTRNCTDGSVDGSSEYTYTSCNETSSGLCTWAGVNLANAATSTFYSTNRPPLGSKCSSYSQVKTCTNGVLSGSASFSFASCVDGLSCTLDGVTVNVGSTTTFYYQRYVPSGETCSSYSLARTCSNSVLSGNTAYRYASCSTAPSGACVRDDMLVGNGSSHLFYSASAAPAGTTCSSVSQTRTCTDGTLGGDGTYQYSSCSDTTGCLLDGAAVPSGTARMFYKQTSVANGILCSTVGAVRTCTNGVLSGDAIYSHASCTVAPPTALGPSGAYLANAYTALKAALETISQILGR